MDTVISRFLDNGFRNVDGSHSTLPVLRFCLGFDAESLGLPVVTHHLTRYI